LEQHKQKLYLFHVISEPFENQDA